jgi:LuxR family transcriptional regulator, maltose regulon positive regulatory protein
VDSNQLLVTKYLVPIVSQPLVPRPRLNRLLEAGLQRKLTLVSAPAGFGKSTLVASWAASQSATQALTARGIDETEGSRIAPQIGWVSLEASDNAPAQFWRYVFTALEQNSATEALNALQAPEQVPLESILTAFINARLERPISSVLILDDYHVITDDAIHRSLSFLLEHLPAQMHVMLLSRTEPPLPLARLRANRQVSEIGVQDLRCTLPETAAFLHDVMGVQLSDEAIAQMMIRTEGWLVGLQLLGLSLQGRRDPSAVLEELSGSQRYVFDYLIDEVLRQQPEVLQRFLLGTSILDRLSAPLCDAVLERKDSQAMLETLERSNLFVIALDERRQWFRYHHLFREALRTRLEALEPRLARDLYLRAGEWFGTNGNTFEMVFHVIQADATSRTLNLSEAERRAQTGYVAAARAHMAAMQGEPERARAFTQVALALLPQESLLERSAAMVAESTAAVADNDFALARKAMLEAAEMMRQAGYPMNALSQTTFAALYAHVQGRLKEAESLLEETLARTVHTDGPPEATVSLVFCLQGHLLLERNRLDAALDLVTRAVQLAEQIGFDPVIELGYPYLSLVHLAHREYGQAQAALERATRIPPEHDTPFVRGASITPVQVRLWLATGELERAQDWARQLRSGSSLTSSYARERLNVAQTRVLIASEQPAQALAILRALLHTATEMGNWDHVLEMWLLQAVAYHLDGDEPAALEVLERAIAFGEPQGYVRRFLDEGPVMASLLSTLRERQPEPDSASYLDRLLIEFQGGASTAISLEAAPRLTRTMPEPPDAAHLTSRETEVLEFLARGLSNDDIARRLEVSKYTVKSHVSSLLSKLEATNRTHAVARARTLGLLENEP